MHQNKTGFFIDKSRLCFERKPFSLPTKAVFARDFLRFSFGHGAKVKIIQSDVASFVAHWGFLVFIQCRIFVFRKRARERVFSSFSFLFSFSLF